MLDLFHRAKQHVDTLFFRKAPNTNDARFRFKTRCAAFEVDKMRDDFDLAARNAIGGKLFLNEQARRDEGRDVPVGVKRMVQPALEGAERAFDRRAANQAASERIPIRTANGRLDDLASVVHPVVRRDEMIVVDGHHGGNLARFGDGEDRRRDLMINVMNMQDVGREGGSERGEFLGGLERPEHTSGRPQAFAIEAHAIGLDLRHKKTIVVRRHVFRRAHRERHDSVAVARQELGQLEHVALRAAFQVVEFVGLEDAHQENITSVSPSAPARRSARRTSRSTG